MNPRNLDDWVDLAFSLRHCGKDRLGTAIFCDLGHLIHHYRRSGVRKQGLEKLNAMVLRINRRGLSIAPTEKNA